MQQHAGGVDDRREQRAPERFGARRRGLDGAVGDRLPGDVDGERVRQRRVSDRASASTDGGRSIAAGGYEGDGGASPIWARSVSGRDPSRIPRRSAPRSGDGADRRRRRLRPMPLAVAVVRLDPDLPLPTYAHPGDAGLDLHARVGATVAGRRRPGARADRDRHRRAARARRLRPAAQRARPAPRHRHRQRAGPDRRRLPRRDQGRAAQHRPDGRLPGPPRRPHRPARRAARRRSATGRWSTSSTATTAAAASATPAADRWLVTSRRTPAARSRRPDRRGPPGRASGTARARRRSGRG